MSLEQKVGSWQTRTVAVSLIHEIGAHSSCHRWALKGSFACLALLKARLRGLMKQGKELLLFRGTSVLARSRCFAIPLLAGSALHSSISGFAVSLTLRG